MRFGFLENATTNLKNNITQTDLYFIGKLKYKLEAFFKFFFKFEKRSLGWVISRSKTDLFNEISLSVLKALSSQRRKKLVKYFTPI